MDDDAEAIDMPSCHLPHFASTSAKESRPGGACIEINNTELQEGKIRIPQTLHSKQACLFEAGGDVLMISMHSSPFAGKAFSGNNLKNDQTEQDQ
eukprot:1160907-Pelagomonas_calceolata.AAC.3